MTYSLNAISQALRLVQLVQGLVNSSLHLYGLFY